MPILAFVLAASLAIGVQERAATGSIAGSLLIEKGRIQQAPSELSAMSD